MGDDGELGAERDVASCDDGRLSETERDSWMCVDGNGGGCGGGEDGDDGDMAAHGGGSTVTKVEPVPVATFVTPHLRSILLLLIAVTTLTAPSGDVVDTHCSTGVNGGDEAGRFIDDWVTETVDVNTLAEPFWRNKGIVFNPFAESCWRKIGMDFTPSSDGCSCKTGMAVFFGVPTETRTTLISPLAATLLASFVMPSSWIFTLLANCIE